MWFSSLSSFVLVAALIPQSYAWGAVGHEIVATVAQMHLHPSVMPKLCEILDVTGECHLAPVAAWADSARRQPKYRWTAPLHYIGAVDDFPSATCVFPGSKGWAGRTHINVLSAIRNTTNVLHEFEQSRRFAAGASGDDEETVPPYVQDALKFLIHFVGDMHMPLHLTGRHRGGNGDKVTFDGRVTNLHSVWDSRLISERLRTLPNNYTRPLPFPEVESVLRDTIYDPYIRRLVWEGVLGTWQDELDAWLVCPAVASPSPTSLARHRVQDVLTSAWQHIFWFLSSSTGGKGENDDGSGLGVDDDAVCPYAWAQPIHELNCEIVFPKELDESHLYHGEEQQDVREEGEREWEDEEEQCGCGDDEHDDEHDDALRRRRKKAHYLELDTPEYVGMIKRKWIVEKLLMQAAVRLAAVLNWIFADLDEDTTGVWRRHQHLSLGSNSG